MPLPRPIKWFGIGLGTLLVLVVVLATTFGLIGRARLNATPALPVPLAELPVDDATIAEGERLVAIFMCRDCHGPELGGELVVDMPLGRFVAPNLTTGAGGIGATYRHADWDRAIRYGIGPDSTYLTPFMPFELYNRISDTDMHAMIAYLRQAPPVDRVLPKTAVRLPGYVAMGVGSRESMFPELGRPPATSPTPGTVEHGAYLANTTCVICHGERLTGGEHPDPNGPAVPSLIHYADWPVDSLAKVVRTGIAPGGRTFSRWMPSTGQLDQLNDEEFTALHAYIRSLVPN